MHFGVCIQSKIDDIDYVSRLEERGYDSAWFADSPTIWSDCYACLALAATRTRTIQLGTGVAVAGLRLATTTVSSIATINRLAPGRTFLAIGNGNTGWRLLGHRPLAGQEFRAELTTIRDLLGSGQASMAVRGRSTSVRFGMAELGFVDLDTPIPLIVSAFGPRNIRLAAEMGDGLVTTLVGESHIAKARSEMGERPVTGMTHAIVLEAGETSSSDRVRQRGGATMLATLHYLYDKWVDEDRPEPPAVVSDIWEDYFSLLEAIPPEVRHDRVHAGHNTFVHPDEWRFVSGRLIERFLLVGSPEQLAYRLYELQRAGLDRLLLLPDLEHRDADTADFSARVMPLLRELD